MLNKIIHFSLSNRVVILVITGILIAAGCVVLSRSEVDIFPDLNAPTVVVMTEATGLAPEEVEKQVTFPVESAMTGSNGVRRTRSTSSAGFSVVWVEFDWGTDIYRARQTVAERLATVSESLPAGVGTPVMGPQSSILGEVLIVGLTPSKTSMLDLRNQVDRDISRQLLATPGVAQVSVIGGQEREMQVLLLTEKMKFHGVELSEVLEALEGSNNNATGTVLYANGNEYIVKGSVNSASPEDIANLVIPTASDKTVRVADIARVSFGGKTPIIGAGSVKGKESIILTITKQPEVDTIELTKQLEDKLEEIKKQLPDDVVVSSDIFRQADFISNSINNLQTSLLEGALMVVIVLFIFMMNARTTIVSLVALPLSIIISVIILAAMGVTINTMTLGGIAIAIGSLVDDAVVDVENVYKRLRVNNNLPKEERKRTIQVVYEASKEVRQPIFNSSLIVIASFLPLFFLSGMEGRMLIPLGIAFIVALAASTIVALTVTPVLCSYLLGSAKGDAKVSKEPKLTVAMKNGYAKALQWCLNHYKPVLGSIALLFIISLAFASTLGRSFLPSFNEGSLTINVSMLPGISLEESNKVGQLAEKIIMSEPEVQTVARKTGRAELSEHSFGANVSEMEVPYVLKDRSRKEFVADLRKKLSVIPGAAIEIGQPISHRLDHMLSGTKAQIAIKLFGNDLSQLYTTGQQIQSVVKSVNGVVDVNLEQQMDRPQIEIKPRRELLARYGIPMNRFSEFVDIALAGKDVSAVYENGYPSALTVKFDGTNDLNVESLRLLPIDTQSGKVPLGNVADINSVTGPNSINRENANRRIVISANVEDDDLRGIVNEIQSRIDKEVKLPQGYYLQYGGQFESEQSASRTLGIASILALVIVVMLLYMEFHNIKESLIILINMPLAMIGGILILVISGRELNIPAIIGFISLLGIATRNGMLLVSRYNNLQHDGYNVDERIKIGSTDRLTPIIMTALTSALAMIPLALRGGEPGNEIQSPMAMVILGGLISSTFLNIFVVPILYRLITKKESKDVEELDNIKEKKYEIIEE